ncbi:hypothetical protein [Streptomyces sp. NPDC005485]|uniref:hypothetical protein n=1 Tax=Streptomyces sp. NPDC005485 TaxID=3155591 RepID=UPI0033A63917
MSDRITEGPSAAGQPSEHFRARDGFVIAAVIALMAALTGAIVFTVGTWRLFARRTVPELLDLPGGPWVVGCALGLLTVSGGFGIVWCLTGVLEATNLPRALRKAATAALWTATFAPLLYLLSSLPGKNCPSYKTSCAYIPGTGSALLAYALSTALTGWLLLRWKRSAAEAQQARERERLRRLRKRGKGKSRRA